MAKSGFGRIGWSWLRAGGPLGIVGGNGGRLGHWSGKMDLMVFFQALDGSNLASQSGSLIHLGSAVLDGL